MSEQNKEELKFLNNTKKNCKEIIKAETNLKKNDPELCSTPKTPLRMTKLNNIPKKGDRKFHWFDAAIVLVSLITFLIDTLTGITTSCYVPTASFVLIIDNIKL